MDNPTQTVYEPSSNEHGGFDFNCPKCGDSLSVYNENWCDPTCSCGYKWHLIIKVVGVIE